MAVTGNLKDISLTNLIQVNAQSGFSGCLSVQKAEENAQIYFTEGEIIHAVLGEISGRDAFNQILGWDDGEFDLATGIAAPVTTINASWSDLILGGLQYLDENSADEAQSQRPEDFPDMGALFGLEKEKKDHSRWERDIISEDNVTKKMQDVLADLGEEATGLFAAAVVGMDGLPVADYSKQSVDAEAFSAQMTLLIKLVDTTTKKVDAGSVEDYLLTTDNAYLLIRFLEGSDYYLGIGAARKTASLGKLRLYSRIYAERLSAILPR